MITFPPLGFQNHIFGNDIFGNDIFGSTYDKFFKRVLLNEVRI